jgi:ATP-dependent Clp endopeptidase proteolytic subunit ClpP
MKIELPEFLRLIKGDIDGDDDGDVTMLLSEPVGFDPYTYTGMSASRFGATLGAISRRKRVTLDINTLGGRVDDGMAMANMITARGNVTTRVIGYAASMGAVILQSGKVRQMMPGTLVVIHNPQAEAAGDEKELSNQAKIIGQVKQNVVDLFAARTGQGKKKISEMMDATTAMTPKEALELGFVDEVIDGSPAYNDFNPKSFFDSCRRIASHTGSVDGGSNNNQQPKDTMKKLLEVLAKLKLIASADLNDEQAATQVEQNAGAIAANVLKLNTERDTLTERLTAHANAQKSRVESKIKLAIDNKLVKVERKDALTAMGIADESQLDAHIADLAEIKGQSVTVRHGARPLPATGEQLTGEQKIDALRAEMRAADITPERTAAIARELRELRGHKGMFAAA